ncbi:rho guanine nucleotide exchange factor [Elysia marginata]|uniref:Rho guanine nucleotide exchange factor n=1 Tax=Elysia marginata TaxID=1093978 RepID=A0AAV4HVX4_9GAST|nr:rho guanine nucleotide exchange factor [Elysia marginata]
MSLSGEAVLYASSPNDRLAQESARLERRRRKVLKELVDTERRYLHHLQLINKYFFFPLKFAYIIPDSVHSILFSNLEEIYDVNVALLEQIEQSSIGAAFSQMGPFLKLYSTYANNHQQALNTLQEWQSKSAEFSKFISKQEDLPPVMGLKLPALLIAPVQRIPRYKLLLEELLHSTPQEHYDYTKLKEATTMIEEIATHINEHIRQNENFQKMLSIQRSFDSSAPKLLSPGRTFIKEGPLKKVSRKGGKSYERMFFLFSDILLYGKPKFLDGGGKSYTCSCVLPLRHCKVEPVFITSLKKADAGGVFKLTCKEENLLLYSDDRENAQQWSQELEKAIRKFCNDRQTLRKPSSNKIPLRGRSLRRHRKEQKKTETKIYGVMFSRSFYTCILYCLDALRRTRLRHYTVIHSPSRQ